MDNDIFKQVKQLVSITDLATHILGEAEHESGSESYIAFICHRAISSQVRQALG